jgi:hypothetical protein
VVQSPFTTLSCLGVSKRDVLIARVIIHAYNQHVRLLSPEPMVLDKPQSTRVSGAGVVMQSSETLPKLLEFGKEAIEIAKRCKPDLIILDLSMSFVNGLDAARELTVMDVTESVMWSQGVAGVLGGHRIAYAKIYRIQMRTDGEAIIPTTNSCRRWTLRR